MDDALAAIEETNYLPRRKNGWRPAPPSPPPQLCRTTIIRMDMDLQQTAIIVRSMPEMVASFRVCHIERQLTLETVDAICRVSGWLFREAVRAKADQKPGLDVIR
jgi:hypothetical protein